MPYHTPCPNCLRLGLVRVEHVIKGGAVSKAFYCGGCEHQWTIVEVGEPEPPHPEPLPKARTHEYGPHRRA